MAHTYSYRSTGFDAAQSTGSSRNPRSSRTGKAQVQHEGEKHELNTLNDRFGSYLEKIKSLAQINASLRRQVDDAYRKYIGHTDGLTEQIYQHPSERQLSQLRQQINEEVRAQTLIQIRLQRADYDVKFYRTHLQLLSAHDQQQSEQIRTMRQQLDVNLRALKQLQDEYHRREQDLKETHSQYAEYMNKLIEFANQYDTVTYERMINENELYTLKERIAFEQEYHQRRQEEVSYLEQIQVDVNKQFKQNEFQQIIQRIRSDYQEFNAIRLEELEGAYKTKLETVRHEVRQRNEQEQQTKKPTEVRQVLDSTKKEHQTLIEQNRSLKGKLGSEERRVSRVHLLFSSRTTRNGSSWHHRTESTRLREDRSRVSTDAK